MTTATQFRRAHCLGPSRHREMPVEQRRALYQRVIGYLRFADKDMDTLSVMARWHLKSAICEAMLITGAFVEDAKEQRRLMSKLLEELNRDTAVHPALI